MSRDFVINGLEVFQSCVSLELIKLAKAEAEKVFPSEAGFFESPYTPEEMRTEFPYGWTLQRRAKQIAEGLVGQNPVLQQSQLTMLGKNSPGSTQAHIDGSRLIKSHGDSIDFLPTFQLIIGIPMVDLSTPGKGSVWFEPGGHHRVSRAIWGNWDRLKGMTTARAFTWIMDVANTDARPPELALVGLGDAYVFHATLPHGSSPNFECDRPVWYFRYGHYSVTGKEAYRTAFPRESWPLLSEESS